MLKNIFNLPREKADEKSIDVIKPGSFAAILARAGVGKTALLVQIAINAMRQEKNVLHISTSDPVDKVDLWYREMLQRLNQDNDKVQIDKMRDQLLRHRFIMTFETESFSIAKLKKRVDELISQEIFVPAQIMIDDFSFETVTDEDLSALKKFVEDNSLIFWFSIRTHRDEAVNEKKLPTRLAHLTQWFDFMIRLDPESDRIYIRPVENGESKDDETSLFLDPSTLLIQELQPQ